MHGINRLDPTEDCSIEIIQTKTQRETILKTLKKILTEIKWSGGNYEAIYPAYNWNLKREERENGSGKIIGLFSSFITTHPPY